MVAPRSTEENGLMMEMAVRTGSLAADPLWVGCRDRGEEGRRVCEGQGEGAGFGETSFNLLDYF